MQTTDVQTAQFDRPISDFDVVSLGIVRDGAPAEVHLDPGKNAVLFSLELPTIGSARYAVTLFNADGDILWRGEDLEPSLYDSLMVAVPPSYLLPGTYRITVEAQPPQPGEPAGEIAFRVTSNSAP